jgi:hypothetical protein
MPAALETPPASTSPAVTPPPAQVPASSVPPPVEVTPAKPGSAKSRLFGDLQKFADTKSGTPSTPPASTPPATPPAKPNETPPGETKPPGTETKPGEDGTKPPGTETPPAEKPGEKPAEGKKGEKVSPWKLVDEHKAARLAAETELAKLRALVPDPAKVEAETNRLKAAETKAADLEKVLAFLDYERSEEYKTKHVVPYEAQWKKIIAELPQIQVKVPGSDQVREATPNDILELMNLPVGEAQSLADAAFGNLSDRVMAWRDKLRDMFDAQQDALKVAKDNAATWKKEQAGKIKEATDAVTKFVSETWTASNEAIKKDPKHSQWLNPVEGDEEINSRLTKGFAMADEAFTADPNAPGLKPEERARAVRLHSALRNRAAAYGRLVLEVTRLTKKLEEVTKERDGYKTSQPPRTPTPPGQAAPGELKGLARVQADLQKIARPG